MFFYSIKTKMTCAAFLLVSLLAITTAIFSLVYYEANIKESLSNQQFALVTSMADDLDDKLSIVQRALNASKVLITAEIINNPHKAQQFLDSQLSLRSMYDNGLYLLTKDGKIIAESPFLPERRGRDISFRDWFRQTVATNKSHLSEPYISTHSPGHPAIIYTLPLFDIQGKLVAILAGSFDLLGKNILQDIITTRVGKTGYLYLCDNNRTIIIHPDRKRIMTKASPVGKNSLFDKAMTGFEGSGETTTSAGVETLTSFKRLRTTNWILAANFPVAEAYAPIRKTRAYFLYGGVGAALLSALLVWSVMSYLTAPLLSFTEHIKGISDRKGNNKFVSIGSKDEIGSLAQAFNSMLTELEQQRVDLKNQLQFLQILMDTIPTPIYYKDMHGKFLGCNAAFEAVYGLSMEQIIGKTSYDFLPAEYANRHHQEDLKILSSQGHISYECSILAKKKRLIDVIIYKSAFSHADGSHGGIIGAMLDISERKLAEKTLRESEQLYRSLVDNIDMGISLVDDRYRIIMVNPALEKFTATSASELIQKNCFAKFEARDEACQDCPGKIAMETGKRITVERKVVLTDASKVVKIHAIPIFGADRKPDRFIEVIEDITVQQSLEEQLLQSQKMEAVGQLAGGVAHDFNNILSVIMGYSHILKADSNMADRQQEKLDQIIAAAERASQLTGGLLAFSRKQVLSISIVNLNELVLHLQKFLERVIGEDIHLKTIVNDADLPVSVDSGQIEQALINLATNARDAMPKGGELTIETGEQEVDASFSHAHGYGQAGRYAVITVADTGSGMDVETQTKIFEPFFTTKEVGKGTGLGLAIVYGIVKQHNGFINLYSEQGKGTTFRVFLPLMPQKVRDHETQAKQPPPRGGEETILVAEDDPVVRNLVAGILADYGYRVLLAADGHEVVAQFRAHRDRVQLILMDMIMPLQDGKAAAEEIRQLQADTRILFASGYTTDFIKSRGVDEEGMELIMKPFKPLDLLCKVREMLDQ